MPQFNAGTYEIYWYKNQEDTPNTVKSPTTSNTVSPVNKVSAAKTGIGIGVGLTVARRAWNTIRNEITASTGDEALQTNINNAMKGLGYIASIVALGPTGALLIGADVALNAISYNREFKRQDILRRYDRELQGKRANIANGSAYYD